MSSKVIATETMTAEQLGQLLMSPAGQAMILERRLKKKRFVRGGKVVKGLAKTRTGYKKVNGREVRMTAAERRAQKKRVKKFKKTMKQGKARRSRLANRRRAKSMRLRKSRNL